MNDKVLGIWAHCSNTTDNMIAITSFVRDAEGGGFKLVFCTLDNPDVMYCMSESHLEKHYVYICSTLRMYENLGKIFKREEAS